jgi:hypothetical protein
VRKHLATLDGAELEQALADEGIGWVVADATAADALAAEGVDDDRFGTDVDLPRAEVLHRGSLLTVWQLAPSAGDPARSPADRLPLLVLLALAWSTAAGTVAGAALGLAKRRSTSRQLRPDG